jgi:hypothetical protein
VQEPESKVTVTVFEPEEPAATVMSPEVEIETVQSVGGAFTGVGKFNATTVSTSIERTARAMSLNF